MIFMIWKEGTATFLVAVLLYNPSSNEKLEAFHFNQVYDQKPVQEIKVLRLQGDFSEVPPPLFIKPDLSGCPDVN